MQQRNLREANNGEKIMNPLKTLIILACASQLFSACNNSPSPENQETEDSNTKTTFLIQKGENVTEAILPTFHQIISDSLKKRETEEGIAISVSNKAIETLERTFIRKLCEDEYSNEVNTLNKVKPGDQIPFYNNNIIKHTGNVLDKILENDIEIKQEMVDKLREKEDELLEKYKDNHDFNNIKKMGNYDREKRNRERNLKKSKDKRNKRALQNTNFHQTIRNNP